MATREQVRRGARRAGKLKVKVRKDVVLAGSPHVRGVCVKVYQRSPKKPNSANRWVARVRVAGGRRVVAHIPGEGNSVQEHASILLRGGRVKDLPGVQHRVVRGALDCVGVKDRVTARSKYGTPRPRAS